MKGYHLSSENPYVSKSMGLSSKLAYYSYGYQQNKERFCQCAVNYYGLSKAMGTRIYSEACLEVRDEVGWRGWKKLRFNEYQHLLFKHGARLMLERANAHKQKRLKVLRKIHSLLRNRQFDKLDEYWYNAIRKGLAPEKIKITILETGQEFEITNTRMLLSLS